MDTKTKLPYTAPTILRVKLEHQQAVLTHCSPLAGTLATMDGDRCNPPWEDDCRKDGSGGGRDDSDSS